MSRVNVTLSEGAPSVLYAPDCIVCGMSASDTLRDAYTGEPIPVCRSHRVIAEREGGAETDA